jgi:hypothetical protein
VTFPQQTADPWATLPDDGGQGDNAPRRKEIAQDRLLFRNVVWNADPNLLPVGPRMVALAYETFAGQNGPSAVWVTEENLMQRTGMRRTALIGHRATLVKMGVLTCVREADFRRGIVAVYRLDWRPLLDGAGPQEPNANRDYPGTDAHRAVACPESEHGEAGIRTHMRPESGRTVRPESGQQPETVTRDVNQELDKQREPSLPANVKIAICGDDGQGDPLGFIAGNLPGGYQGHERELAERRLADGETARRILSEIRRKRDAA